MKVFYYVLILICIIPVFAYEVYTPNTYKYDTEIDKLLFVLDYSNSMGEYFEHETKINQVKLMMYTILPQISQKTKVGLRVYGHTCNPIAYNACRSSELLVPLGYNTSGEIFNKMEKIRPRGMTPITYSLKQAVNKDLNGLNGQKHIILLTDGGENCDESPCEYSIELIKKRRDIIIDVIAFNVHNEDDLAQLECTANVTGGRLVEVNTNAQLLQSMRDLIAPHKSVEALIYDNKN